MGFIQVFGKSIYFEMFGTENEKTLLYLHGGPGASCLDFHNQAKAIGKTHRVFAIDQYGVLRSQAIGADEKYGMRLQIDMLEEMRRLWNIEKWSLIGHSYGGMLTCLYASLYPEAVSSVVYECPSFNFVLSAKSSAVFLRQYFQNAANEEGIRRCEKIENTIYREGDTAVVRDLINALSLVTDPKVRNYLHNVSYEEYASCFVTDEITDEMWAKGQTHLEKLLEDPTIAADFLPLLSQNPQPALCMTGKYDPVCGADQIRTFVQQAVHPHVVEFSNSGHFPRIEEAAAYTEKVCDFIRQYGG